MQGILVFGNWLLVYIVKMGETLGISVNVFEKVAREKDRKERLKRYS